MFRQLFRALEPLKNSLTRTVGGAGSAFERNCVSKEQQLTEALKKAIPGITYVSVEDISGGCGAMFEVQKKNGWNFAKKQLKHHNGGSLCMCECVKGCKISIEAKEFVGLSRVKQHRIVTESLKSEIAEMHGIRIHTNPSKVENN